MDDSYERNATGVLFLVVQAPCRKFEGTLFRLPLRNKKTAAKSKIVKEPVNHDDVEKLLIEFARRAKDMILFTRNVETVKLFYRRPGEEASLLVEVTVSEPL